MGDAQSNNNSKLLWKLGGGRIELSTPTSAPIWMWLWLDAQVFSLVPCPCVNQCWGRCQKMNWEPDRSPVRFSLGKLPDITYNDIIWVHLNPLIHISVLFKNTNTRKYVSRFWTSIWKYDESTIVIGFFIFSNGWNANMYQCVLNFFIL
jgi:hypothetical protein